MRLFLAFATFALCTLVIACDGDGDSRTRSLPVTPEATPTRAPGPPCTNEATREAVFDAPGLDFPDDEVHCRLRRAALSERDLDGEWHRVEVRELTDEGSFSECWIGDLPDVVGGVELMFTAAQDSRDQLNGEVLDDIVRHSLYGFATDGAIRAMHGIDRSCGLVADEGGESGLGGTFVGFLADGERLHYQHTLASLTFDIRVERYEDVISVLRVQKDAELDIDLIADSISKRLSSIGTVAHLAPTLEGQACPPPTAPDDHDKSAVLEQALLAPEDLSAGWVENPPEPCGLVIVSGDCGAFDGPESAGYVEDQFSGRHDGFVYEALELFDGDDAREVFEDQLAKWDEELKCTVEFGDEYVQDRRYLPVGGEPFGSDVIVWRILVHSENSGVTNMAAGVMFRSGNVIAWLVHSFGDPYRDRYAEPGEPLSEVVLDELTPIIETSRRKLEAIQPQLD